jgi:hypothetical protein
MNLHIYFRVLTILYIPIFAMLVPEHLVPILDQLDSWDSRRCREFYEDIIPRVPDAVGLAFAPTNIAASWIDAAGALQVLKQPVSSEYRQLYEKTVEHYGEHHNYSDGDKDDLRTMFALNFSPITSALAERMGHEPTYCAFFLPTVFGESMCNIAGQALGSFRIRWAPSRATNLAMGVPWEFWYGKNLAGRSIERGHDDSDPLPTYVLQLEYEQDHLLAFVHEIDAIAMGEVLIEEHRKFSRGCGERFRKVGMASSHSKNNTENDQTKEDLGAQAYYERLTTFMKDFISDSLQVSTGISSLEDIRAIFIAGEVSAASVLNQSLRRLGRRGSHCLSQRQGRRAILLEGCESLLRVEKCKPADILRNGRSYIRRLIMCSCS